VAIAAAWETGGRSHVEQNQPEAAVEGACVS
jgi:hypothetical protein